jgi:CelD/BcsL family acetyltransferase involved in cellulose biosynthesis
MSSLDVRDWQGIEGLAAQRDAWLALVEASGVDPLCNHPDWVLCHAHAFCEPSALFGFTLSDAAGEPVAVLPFRREPSRGAFALRRARLAPAGTFDSDYLDLPVRPGHERAVAHAALEALHRARGIDVAVLDCVPDDSPRLAALVAALGERDLPFRVHAEPCCTTSLPDSFEAFLGGLRSRMRSKVRSSIRKVEERGAELAWCDDPSELERGLVHLFDLHQRRWTASGEPGSFASDRRRAFYRSLSPALLAEGRLGFTQLHLDGRIVATQIGAFAGSTYYQLQEGYDPELADLRLGIALRGLTIRDLIERGTTRYDFMAGVTRGKTDWGAVPRPCTTLAFALPGLRARGAYGLRALVDRWRARS